MQATVQSFDPAIGSGHVVTDAGLVLPFAAEAFATSGLRLLRPGQRVSIVVQGEGAQGEVIELWLEGVGYVPSRSTQSGSVPRS